MPDARDLAAAPEVKSIHPSGTCAGQQLTGPDSLSWRTRLEICRGHLHILWDGAHERNEPQAVQACADALQSIESIERAIECYARNRASGKREIVNVGTGRRAWIEKAEDVKSALLQPPGNDHNGKWRCAACNDPVHDGECKKKYLRAPGTQRL